MSAHRNAAHTKRGWRFWTIFTSVALSSFLAALDLTAVSVALPTIAADLHGADFTWIGSAYALTSTAFLPAISTLANAFGRRFAMLVGLGFFALGSGICGGAASMNMLIAGRAVQGMGGGGLMAMARIVISDMCTLAERGTYFGILGGAWALAAAVGPLAGALLSHRWRWIFYLNLPCAALAAVLVVGFMDVKTPRIGVREGIDHLDIIGKALIMGSTACVIVGITFGGSRYAWSDARVYVPLSVGCALSVLAMIQQTWWTIFPTVPFTILHERTAVIGYLSTFLHGNIMMILLYYGSVWYQGVRQRTAVQGTIGQFTLYFACAICAMLGGLGVKVTGRYKPFIITGWVLTVLGTSLYMLLKPDISVGFTVGAQLLQGIGLGLIYVTSEFAVLASVPVHMSTEAISFVVFCRTYGQAWGVSIGSTILQNRLKSSMPSSLSVLLHGSMEEAYSMITKISSIPPPYREIIIKLLNHAIRDVWLCTAVVAGVGLLLVVWMREHELHETKDESWGMIDVPSEASTPAVDKEHEDINWVECGNGNRISAS